MATSPLAKPSPPFTNNPQETSLGVWWQPVEGATEYRLTFRQFPAPWDSATVLTFPADTTKTTVDGLAPTSTYQFKLAVVAGGDVSQLSDAASGDTLAANCGPKKDKKKCVIS